MKLAVISDTHNLLREEVKDICKDCDLILHAGDICAPAVYDALVSLGKPLLTVRGNNDGRWAAVRGIPHMMDTSVVPDAAVNNLRIFMVHDRRDIPPEILAGEREYDLVVFGHSHKYETFRVGNTLFINPGSCGPVRFRLPVTMAVVEISDSAESAADKFSASCIDFAREKQGAAVREIPPGEMKMLVTRVVKDIKRNKSAEYIAKKYQISIELSKQICRLYLTHPGVTVDGILGKMGM